MQSDTQLHCVCPNDREALAISHIFLSDDNLTKLHVWTATRQLTQDPCEHNVGFGYTHALSTLTVALSLSSFIFISGQWIYEGNSMSCMIRII